MTIKNLVQTLSDKLRHYKMMLATAESCTGGMIATNMTDIAGSSAVFERGFVTYSNEAKHDMLGVPTALIENHGAVSEDVARAMAEGALAKSRAHIALSCTGIAGPSGGTKEKPVGLVYIGVAIKGGTTQIYKIIFDGDRDAVRAQTVHYALEKAIEALE